MAYAERRGGTWRVKYKKPDGAWASESGFETKESALAWGRDQETDIRRNTWIDPTHAQEKFGPFAEKVFATARVSNNTRDKNRSNLDCHILPQWKDWPLGAIFNDYLEIERWAQSLHEKLAEASVATVFGYFSHILAVAVKARKTPANPARDVRVTTGEYEPERQVATPVQFLRAAVRLHASFGRVGFVLALMNGYTGARWSELVGLRPHDYDEVNHAVPIRTPLLEVSGKFETAKKTKTPAGKRSIELPPFLDALYTDLIEACESDYLFTGPKGGLMRRRNFQVGLWRPAWNGDPRSDQAWLRRPLLPGFTFHEGRHTQRTWLAEDEIPEVARAARLGHKMLGMARVYEHVTPQMRQRVLSALESRWTQSVAALSDQERETLFGVVPLLEEHYCGGGENRLSGS
ncbi:tyrosine-type recombinase/integrase [Nocardiopsis sp. YSL2]|uniref:tyrosine-type recombinase/integrase n=1 Tax=Nocardiopsis sp. YSL2 TaxID=2939492 RepID=UPI0026F43F2A|nr:tyrosine-type recombinase/integrase [Nocardiopsis sp. YSL2]